MWTGQAPCANRSCCPIQLLPAETLSIPCHSFLADSSPLFPLWSLICPSQGSALPSSCSGCGLSCHEPKARGSQAFHWVTQTPALRPVLCVLGAESWDFNVKMADLFHAPVLGRSEPYAPQVSNREPAVSVSSPRGSERPNPLVSTLQAFPLPPLCPPIVSPLPLPLPWAWSPPSLK